MKCCVNIARECTERPQGPLVSEVYHVYSRWAALVFRLYNGSRTFQVEWTVGPVDVRHVMYSIRSVLFKCSKPLTRSIHILLSTKFR